ncbi:MAG: hypothetical protein JSS76_18315 [Bacteroidetes bacterium]|nr:hypothetical protein [Bacteroidota bacterium]
MKLKNILIALLMIIGTTLMAQEKYEQAIVTQNGYLTSVSIEGKLTQEEKSKSGSDYTGVLLNKLAELRNGGWEIWNSTAQPGWTIYFLRRKLK